MPWLCFCTDAVHISIMRFLGYVFVGIAGLKSYECVRHVQGSECRSVSFAGIILRNPRDRWLRPATAFRTSRRRLPSLLTFACVVITDGFHVLLPTVAK